MRQEVLRLERVSCQEGGVSQLVGFNLSVLAGEIIGLLPLDNHGLTALLRLLQGRIPLRYGYMYYREEQVDTWRNPKQRARRRGMIQSESCLVEGLTVTDNIFVLRPRSKSWLLRPSALQKQLMPFLESIGIRIPIDAYVEDLSAFEKVVVDVLKSVVAGHRLIVLRDISADICEAELEKIHGLMRHYAGHGFSFLYIDFHFEELRRVCDKLALMSNGRIVKVLHGPALTPDSLRSYTRAYSDKIRKHIDCYAPVVGEKVPVVEAREVTGDHVEGLNFTAASGECVVLQSSDDQVYGELLSILAGERAPHSGEMLVDGRAAAPLVVGGDVALIQELPTKTMLYNEMDYLDNLCFLLDRRMPEIWRDQGMRQGIRREYAAELGEDVFDKRVDMLSEAQKYELVYTRVAIGKPKAVFCVQPFRQAYMDLRMHIWGLIRRLLDSGMAVVILTVNLADSLPLADRLVRIRKGQPDEVYPRGDFQAMPIDAPWIELFRRYGNNR